MHAFVFEFTKTGEPFLLLEKTEKTEPKVDRFLFNLLSSKGDRIKFSKSIEALEKAFYQIFWYGLERPLDAISGQGGIKLAICGEGVFDSEGSH